MCAGGARRPRGSLGAVSHLKSTQDTGNSSAPKLCQEWLHQELNTACFRHWMSEGENLHFTLWGREKKDRKKKGGGGGGGRVNPTHFNVSLLKFQNVECWMWKPYKTFPANYSTFNFWCCFYHTNLDCQVQVELVVFTFEMCQGKPLHYSSFPKFFYMKHLLWNKIKCCLNCPNDSFYVVMMMIIIICHNYLPTLERHMQALITTRSTNLIFLFFRRNCYIL